MAVEWGEEEEETLNQPNTVLTLYNTMYFYTLKDHVVAQWWR